MSDPMAFLFVRLALNNLGSHKCGPARTHTETIHRYDDLLYGLFWDIHIKLHCDGYSHGLVPTGYSSLFGMVRISTHDSREMIIVYLHIASASALGSLIPRARPAPLTTSFCNIVERNHFHIGSRSLTFHIGLDGLRMGLCYTALILNLFWFGG